MAYKDIREKGRQFRCFACHQISHDDEITELTQRVLVPTHIPGNTLDLVITIPGVNISDLAVSYTSSSINFIRSLYHQFF